MAVKFFLILFGGALIFMGVVFAFLMRAQMNRVLKQLKNAQVITAKEISLVPPGQWIAIEGVLSPSNEPLIEDLVIGCEETYRYEQSGTERSVGHWVVSQNYHQILKVDLPDAGQVLVDVEDSCPPHDPVIIDKSQTDRIRYVGYRAGTSITAMGKAQPGETLKINEAQFSSRSREEWMNDLKSGAPLAIAGGITLMALGGFLIYWQIRALLGG